MERRQLEMRLENAGTCRRPASRDRRRPTRARWWFDQMRRVVEEASSWQPEEPAHPREP